MEKLFEPNDKINKLKSEIYILLVDDLYFDYSEAEQILEAKTFIIGGKSNTEVIHKINHKFNQIKELQSFTAK
jgi:hypothetical protein